MKKILTDKEYKRLTDELEKVTYKCKCGHKEVIPKWLDKKNCSWCGRYIFKSKEDEDKYRIKEILNYGKK